MCETCPFHPTGNGHAVNHEDFPSIVYMVGLAGDFPCHQTTGVKEGKEPTFGEPGQQQCLGATKYRKGELSLTTIVTSYWVSQGYEIVDEQALDSEPAS